MTDKLDPADYEELLLFAHQAFERGAARYGPIRNLPSVIFRDRRIVWIGSAVMALPITELPANFFHEYLIRRLTGDWGQAQLKLPRDEMHPIMQWHLDVLQWLKNWGKPGERIDGPATGSMAAYLSVAYDLYTLDHLSLLGPRLLARIKNTDQFQGARYELFVCATLLRAGFTVEFEDESDGLRTHPDLTATYPPTGKRFSVEMTCRMRPGLMGRPGAKAAMEGDDPTIYRSLQHCLLKQVDHDLVAFVDVNMPPSAAMIDGERGWVVKAGEAMHRLVDRQRPTEPYQPAFVFLTNFTAHHIGSEEAPSTISSFWTAINRPEFRVESGISSAEDLAKIHPEMARLHAALVNFSEPPHDWPE